MYDTIDRNKYIYGVSSLLSRAIDDIGLGFVLLFGRVVCCRLEILSVYFLFSIATYSKTQKFPVYTNSSQIFLKKMRVSFPIVNFAFLYSYVSFTPFIVV